MAQDEALTLVSIVKAAVGPFMGAALAFASALIIQRRNRRRDNLVAGNLALLTLANQYNDVLVYRKGLRNEIQQRLIAMGPTAPAWMLAPPVQYLFLDARSLDLRSLAFLFERREGAELYQKLSLSDHHYQSLRLLAQDMVSNVVEVQKDVAALGKEGRVPTNEEVGRSVSIDKRARTRDLLLALIRETQEDEKYVQAFTALRTALSTSFGKKAVPKAIEAPPGHRLSDLPPLPDSLTDPVEQVPDGTHRARNT